MMRKRAITLLAVTVALVACASPAPPERGMRSMPPRMSAASDGLDLLPRSNWWHETRLNESLHVTGEQMQQLDALQKTHADEITRLQNDLHLMTRDLRGALERRDAQQADIIAAGERLAQLRDDLFRRQVAYLAAQRAVLSLEQWQSLQQQLAEHDEEHMGPPGRGGGGRGGFGGSGGRRPPRGGNW